MASGVRLEAAVNAPHSRRFASSVTFGSRDAFGVRVSLAPLFGAFNVRRGRSLEDSSASEIPV